MKFYLGFPLIGLIIIASLFLAVGTGDNPSPDAAPPQAAAVPAPIPIRARPRTTPGPALQEATAIVPLAAPTPLTAEATPTPQAPIVASRAQSFPGFLIFMVAGLIMIIAGLLHLNSAKPAHRTARPVAAEA